MIVDRQACLLGDFEFNRSACFPLADRCAVHGIAVRGDILDLQAHEITTAKLAVDGKIEQSQIPGSAGDLQSRPDGPDVFWLEWRFRSSELPFVPWSVLTNIAIGET